MQAECKQNVGTKRLFLFCLFYFYLFVIYKIILILPFVSFFLRLHVLKFKFESCFISHIVYSTSNPDKFICKM